MLSTKLYECSRLLVPLLSSTELKLMTTMTKQVPGIPRVATEDTSLVTSNIRGEKTTVPVPKGTEVVIDAAGVHYNRTYLVAFT